MQNFLPGQMMLFLFGGCWDEKGKIEQMCEEDESFCVALHQLRCRIVKRYPVFSDYSKSNSAHVQRRPLSLDHAWSSECLDNFHLDLEEECRRFAEDPTPKCLGEQVAYYYALPSQIVAEFFSEHGPIITQDGVFVAELLLKGCFKGAEVIAAIDLSDGEVVLGIGRVGNEGKVRIERDLVWTGLSGISIPWPMMRVYLCY
ncbi:MAG: hypothetical protein K0S20_360 [Patescibacteria group bacterium]|jgi:hypothetical protein|nr:hypothetical protein [Patescibacteria group bacterium]